MIELHKLNIDRPTDDVGTVVPPLTETHNKLQGQDL